MNGYIELTNEWINLNGATVIDVNGNKNTLAMLPDDEFYLQVDGSYAYGNIGVYFWHGTQPTTVNARGAEVLPKGEQGKLKKGVDDIWVKAVTGKADLIIRKVQ